MKIIGMHGSSDLMHETGIGYTSFHDAAAVLVDNGKVVCGFEEERLNRIKHTNKAPVNAIRACLDFAGISIDDIDYFAISQEENEADAMLKPFSAREFLSHFLKDEFGKAVNHDKFLFFDHHYSHAASAYYSAPFDECLLLTLDGDGGKYSGRVFHGVDGKIASIHNYNIGQSIGHFYSMVTMILGFKFFDDYKVMGLAPYGDSSKYRQLFQSFYTLLPEGEFSISRDKVDDLTMIRTIGLEDTLTQDHKDIAASLQEALEVIVMHILGHFAKKTGCRNLGLAGGVALNCTMNGNIMNSGLFDNVFVFPAANDSGLPIGSAFAACAQQRNGPIDRVQHLYLGKDIGDNAAIVEELSKWSDLISFEELADIEKKVAHLLAENNVVGWIQGRSEFGPRALGNRSILANPTHASNKERVNAMVKKREAFRPFAPSVLREHLSEYFEAPTTDFPFMTFILKVKSNQVAALGAVTHVDRTARVQTVSLEHNPRYWKLISEFKKISDIPVLLNTSFNNNAEPIVDSVRDSIVCFLTTGIDYLAVGDFIVRKKRKSNRTLANLRVKLPPYIRLCRISSHELGIPLHTYWITNTYNNVKIQVEEEIFKLLQKKDHKRPISAKLKASNYSVRKKASILSTLFDLWGKRLVCLEP
ncbi:MAG: hypothetical protein DI539_09380 [Flavobacterium psychrophilum]|jgi:carbamoyltransferase|nr:MAG: hypothetical protein DI539_09380 [Flavobacterium psychrophilum]